MPCRAFGDARCAVFFYDDLLRNPAAEVRRLLQFSGVTIRRASSTPASASSIRPCAASVVERPAAAGEEPLEMCRSVYMHLRALLADGNDSPSPAAIDEGLRAGRAALRLLAPSPEERRPLLEIRFAELELAQTTIRDLRIAYDHAAALATEKEEEITVAREAIVRARPSAGRIGPRARRARGRLRDARRRDAGRARNRSTTSTSHTIVPRHWRERRRRRSPSRDRRSSNATIGWRRRRARSTNASLPAPRSRPSCRSRAERSTTSASRTIAPRHWRAEKESEITVARQAIVERDHQLEASARALDERVAACATLEAELQVARGTIDDLRVAHDRAAALAAKGTEITVARQAIVERDQRLAAVEALERELEADQRELEGRVEHDADTLKEMSAELAAWHERKRALLQSMVARLDGARGFWRRLFVSVGAIRTEAALARSLVGSSRLLAHFDQPASNVVDEGDVQFTGWCLHPARELTGLDLQLNGVSFPTRFGLDRPDVGAAYPDAPGSAHSGFLVSAPLAPGRYLVTLEAQCKDLGSGDLRRTASSSSSGVGRRGSALRHGWSDGAGSSLTRRPNCAAASPTAAASPPGARFRHRCVAPGRNSRVAAMPIRRCSRPEGFTPPAPIDHLRRLARRQSLGAAAGGGPARFGCKLPANLPRISVVTPVYRPDLRYFLETADSVRGQVYDNWEWCLADDASNDAGLTATLRELAARDPRIRFVTRTENGHISARHQFRRRSWPKASTSR